MSAERRFIAEWEPVEAVLIAIPSPINDNDWFYIYDDFIKQYKRIINAFTENRILTIILCNNIESVRPLLGDLNFDFIRFVEIGLNDTWTRDYGPLAIEKDNELRMIDFGFNGWGLKFPSDKDNLVNLRLHNRGIINQYRNFRDFILEGGSVETDGNGTLLTTSNCLCSPNRNGGKSKHELNEILYNYLGTDHILWLDYGNLAGDDTDSHIDTLARICPHNTILFTGCRDDKDSHFEPLLKMRAQLMLFRNKEGEPYNLIELPLPDPIQDPIDGHRLPATYTNYLIVNDTIFIPTYNQTLKDDLACRSLKIVFPDHRIVPIDCTTLIRQHGSLHCATMQIHKGCLNLEKL